MKRQRRNPRTRRGILVFLVLVCVAGFGVGHQAGASAPKVFPLAGDDIINHVVQVQLDVGANGSIEETLTFQGEMRISRQDPFTTEGGFRQVDFTVESWDAVAVSQVLNTEIVYALTDGPQLLSRVTAEQTGSDYPAYFKFNLFFDAFSGGALVFAGHHGMPEGGGHPDLPPHAGSPPFLTFEAANIEFIDPILGLVRLIPLDCNDQKSYTLNDTPATSVVGLVLLTTLLGGCGVFVAARHLREDRDGRDGGAPPATA